MKKAVIALAVALVVALAGISGTQAAAKKMPEPVAKAGEEVKTDYFTVVVPEGWLMPMEVKKQAQDAITAVFATGTGNIAVTLSVMPAPLTGKELATQTAANMEKSGLKTTQPEEKDGLWHVGIDGKGKKGLAIFGSNGKLCTATIIFGEDIAKADALFKNLKANDPAIFPKSI